MKRRCILLSAFASILMLLTPTAGAQDIDAALENTLTDHLISIEDVKWYRFDMSEPGDAIISVTGLQEKWDGYAYHWRCAVYRDDLETNIL